MFENLKKAIIESREAEKERCRFYIVNGWYPTWNEAERANPDRGLERYSTPAKWNAYKAGTLTREKAVAYAVKRMEREEEKHLAKQLEKLERAAAAPDLTWAAIHVYWKRSATWGYNPTAEMDSNNGHSEGRASGCGYDKGSAAVADALNANPSALRVLYIAAEKALAEGKQPNANSLNPGCVSWRGILGYGSGYSVLPYFEGGVGVSEYAHIFENCGYKWSSNRSAKHYDYYSIEKAEKPEPVQPGYIINHNF